MTPLDETENRVGDLVVAEGILSADELETLRRRAESAGSPLSRLLLARRLIDAKTLARLIRQAMRSEPDPEPEPEPEVSPGGRFELIELLGEGSTATVYRARDRHLGGQEVAVKFLRERWSEDRTITRRFRREGRLARELDHPGFVPLLDAGEEAGKCFLVTEFVDGRSLAAHFEDRDLDRPTGIRIVEGIARALEEAHRIGVVHRDLKPDNVLVDRTGQPRILDFGAARWTDASIDLTAPGTLLGTPFYMAPEQVDTSRGPIGPWTDVWALGAILYQHLTGSHPFSATTFFRLARAILETDPIPLSERDATIPAAIEAVVREALERDPEARIRSAGQLADRLAEGNRGPASDA